MGSGAGTIPQEAADRERAEERIRLLRRRVYGRDPRPEDVAALAAALAQPSPLPGPASPAVERPPAAAPEAAAVEPAARPGPQPAPSVRRALATVRRVPPSLLAGGVAVAVVAALAGAGALLLVERPTAADAAPAAPRYSPALSVAADPAVLRRPARAADRTTTLVGPDLVAGSFRRLTAYPSAGVTLWAARDRFGERCLVVADIYYRTACAPPATADASGLVLVWASGPGYPQSTTESYTAVWRDGRLSAGRSAP